MIFTFVVLSGVLVVNIVINTQGGYLSYSDIRSWIDYTTIANFHGFSNMTSNSKAATWVSDSSTNATTYFFIDVGCTLLLILLIFLMKVYINLLMEKLKKE